jgi:hypothetical protein
MQIQARNRSEERKFSSDQSAMAANSAAGEAAFSRLAVRATLPGGANIRPWRCSHWRATGRHPGLSIQAMASADAGVCPSNSSELMQSNCRQRSLNCRFQSKNARDSSETEA